MPTLQVRDRLLWAYHGMMSQHFRTLWLSDIHLGTTASRATDLINFLDQVTADTIYLVGDIIDLQRMKSKPSFPPEHRLALGRLIEIANGDTRVVYVPGNHDVEFRQVAGTEICGVEVCAEAEHVTARGERLLTFHGDVLDAAIREGTNLERFASAVYFLLVEADVHFQRLRTRLGGEFSPLSTRIKTRLSGAIEYIRRFEDTAARYAKERGFDGVVCGHIHRPEIREIEGICYANDGDWVEHRTALAEDDSGSLMLLRYETGGITVIDRQISEPLAA